MSQFKRGFFLPFSNGNHKGQKSKRCFKKILHLQAATTSYTYIFADQFYSINAAVLIKSYIIYIVLGHNELKIEKQCNKYLPNVLKVKSMFF